MRVSTGARDLTGFNWSNVPAVLAELGFLTNPTERRIADQHGAVSSGRRSDSAGERCASSAGGRASAPRARVAR